jgi:hypothetical protein
MAYTTIDKPTDYFNTVTYTGNGGTQSINVGFQPDWSWFKSRDASNYHALIDSVRGETKVLYSNGTDAEGTFTAVDFTSTGYDLTHNVSLNSINSSGSTKVAWNWLAGGTASSNSDGSITSSVSANTTAGFSIVSYTGTGSNATIGHGLNAVPKMYIVKDRDASSSWNSYHVGLSDNNKVVKLNTTDAETQSGSWNGTAPTSSVFSLGTSGTVNGSGNDYIVYCFAEKKGYSKFGSYEANNSTDGTFVYTGFKPALIILKAIDQAGDWFIFDNKRDIDNAVSQILYPNLSSSEGSASVLDFVSNGVKIRNSGSGGINYSGTYIYMAFSESPFVTSTGIPTTAR